MLPATLCNKETGAVGEKRNLYRAKFALTESGAFVINGAEHVVVSGSFVHLAFITLLKRE